MIVKADRASLIHGENERSFQFIGGVLMELTSIQDAETKISELVEHSSRLQAELREIQTRSRYADSEKDVGYFNEERIRIRNNIDTTQREILILEQYIREARVRTLSSPPRTIKSARDEVDTLLVQLPELRSRIDSTSERGLSYTKMIAQRRFISARLHFLGDWIKEQRQLPNNTVVKVDDTIPSCSGDAAREINTLSEKIADLIRVFEDFDVSGLSEERLSLLLQIKQKEARIGFLRELLPRLSRNRLPTNFVPPDSVAEARSECERLAKEVNSIQHSLKRLPRHDNSGRRAELANMKCGVDQRLNQLHRWISEQDEITRAGITREYGDILKKSATDEPESIQNATTEFKRIVTFLGAHKESEVSCVETFNKLRQRKNFLARWISELRHKDGNEFAGIDLETQEGILSAVDRLLSLISQDDKTIIFDHPERVAVWNALRSRIGFKPMHCNVSKLTT